MTEQIKLIKAKELKVGDEILQAGFFREVVELKEKEGAITIGCQSGDLVCYQFFDIDSLFAVKTHCQNEDTEPDEQEDATNPSHYTQGEYEVIDILQDKLTPEGFEGFLIGNTLKYMFRERHKNGTEDVKKAAWYMSKLINVRSENKCS